MFKKINIDNFTINQEGLENKINEDSLWLCSFIDEKLNQKRVLELGSGSGLISIFITYPFIQTILQIAGSIYLLYLSYRIYNSFSSENNSRSKPITFLESSLFQYVNPKGVMMAITTISIYTDFKSFSFINTFIEGMIFILIAFTISNIFAVLTWTSVGVFLNNFIKSERSIKTFNGFMAILLILTVIWINYEFYGS